MQQSLDAFEEVRRRRRRTSHEAPRLCVMEGKMRLSPLFGWLSRGATVVLRYELLDDGEDAGQCQSFMVMLFGARALNLSFDLDVYQQVIRRDLVTRYRHHLHHRTGSLGDDLVVHFHGFEHGQGLS